MLKIEEENSEIPKKQLNEKQVKTGKNAENLWKKYDEKSQKKNYKIIKKTKKMARIL